MAYIGSTPTAQGFSPAIDYFNGDGSTTVFTLSRSVATAAQVQIVVNNVPQNPGSAFTVVGNSVTFSSPPPVGAGNIYIYYTTLNSSAIAPSAGTVSPPILSTGGPEWDVDGNLTVPSTGFLQLPVGTTAQRPAGAAGRVRQNSTTGNPEWWDATTSTWLQFSQPAGYTVQYLVVAGGAGGCGGGGGAGGLLSGSSTTLSSGTAYTITVGAGGAGGISSSSNGTNGSNSAFSTFATAVGGGGGAGLTDGVAGGSGGGAIGSSAARAGGAGTAGQGNAGGSNGGGQFSGVYPSGGGGGAGAIGGAGSASGGGAGGIGATSTISGTSLYYAGGGGGTSATTAGAGGIGGGGAGTTSATGVAGTVNTGGGGGGAATTGGAGGSGVVIIAYLGSQRGTGGNITSSGGYTIHTFTSSGTYTA